MKVFRCRICGAVRDRRGRLFTDESHIRLHIRMEHLRPPEEGDIEVLEVSEEEAQKL